MEQDDGFGRRGGGVAEVVDVAVGAQAADDGGAGRGVHRLALGADGNLAVVTDAHGGVLAPDKGLPRAGGGGNVTNSTVTTNATAATSLDYPSTYVGTVSSNRPTASTYPSGTPYPVSTNVTATAGKGNNPTPYDHILDTGDYYLSGIANGEQMLVRGNARLWVAGSIAMQGASQITIANTGTLQVWVGGTVDIGGNGVVNSTSDATHLALYGLPTCTSISLGGNAAWTGTIYAPQADFKSGGGGSDNYDVVGAVIVNTVSMNGHFEFHYDENLGRNGPSGTFVISSWVEL